MAKNEVEITRNYSRLVEIGFIRVKKYSNLVEFSRIRSNVVE